MAAIGEAEQRDMPEPAKARRSLPILGMLAGPAVLALAVLTLAGFLGWPLAAAAAAAVAVVMALLLRRHLRGLRGLRRAIAEIGRGEGRIATLEDPLFCPGLGESLAEALRLERQRRRELTAATAGADAVLIALPDPLFMLSGQGRIVRANAAAGDLFGEALSGRDFASVLRTPEVLEAVDEVLAGAADRLIEFSLTGPVERYFTARIVRLEAPAPDGTVAIVSLHDLTAMKRAEQMRADFVANASHELRTPLASLLGFIETLRGPARDDSEASARFLAVMDEQAKRMARLVEDLLSLSRIELSEHMPPRGRVEVPQVLQTVISALEPQVRARQMTIERDLAPTPPVIGEADELAQVFQNLIDNALKYGTPGTAVRIAVRPAGPGSAGARRLGRPGVKVAVSDQSEGIAREHLARLTERFYRVDTARSRRLGGTGLGLAIVKHVINRHRGVLDIDSTPGKGSTFTVYLPAATGAADPEAAAEGAVEKSRKSAQVQA